MSCKTLCLPALRTFSPVHREFGYKERGWFHKSDGGGYAFEAGAKFATLGVKKRSHSTWNVSSKYEHAPYDPDRTTWFKI
jgi:hypothetical protein